MSLRIAIWIRPRPNRSWFWKARWRSLSSMTRANVVRTEVVGGDPIGIDLPPGVWHTLTPCVGARGVLRGEAGAVLGRE
jgi:hypothetical protein